MKTATSVLGSVLFLAFGAPAFAAAPQLVGQIRGVEITPQSLVGSAVFVIEFSGVVNGRAQRGYGYIEVNHGDLPEPGSQSAITRGSGVLWIGLRQYKVTRAEGLLYGVAPDLFGLDVALDIRQAQQTAAHRFVGGLSHQVFPPVIGGDLVPVR